MVDLLEYLGRDMALPVAGEPGNCPEDKQYCQAPCRDKPKGCPFLQWKARDEAVLFRAV